MSEYVGVELVGKASAGRWARVRPLVLGFIGALLGVGLVLVGLHLKQDHDTLHQIVALFNRAAASAQAPAQAPK
jgi:hypothetical protein